MKITFINGSPKASNSASGLLLDELSALRPKDCITTCGLHTPCLPGEMDLEAFSLSDAAVFAFPLYVDGIPSHLLHCLCQLEKYFIAHPSALTVYVIINCGFFEGKQNRYAIEIMKNWCARSGLKWGMGIGIGGGGMITGIQQVPAGVGPRKNFSAAICRLSEHLTAGTTAEDLYIQPNVPRIAYKFAAESEWRRQIKANDLSKKDLFRAL